MPAWKIGATDAGLIIGLLSDSSCDVLPAKQLVEFITSWRAFPVTSYCARGGTDEPPKRQALAESETIKPGCEIAADKGIAGTDGVDDFDRGGCDGGAHPSPLTDRTTVAELDDDLSGSSGKCILNSRVGGCDSRVDDCELV